MDTQPDSPIFCSRCAKELEIGSGTAYWVEIKAVCDPHAIRLLTESDPASIRAEMESLWQHMESESEQELRDGVYRRCVFHLCRPCYEAWIEDPFGSTTDQRGP